MHILRAAGTALLLLAQCAWAQSPIRLKTRTIHPLRRDVLFRPPARSASGSARTHYIVQFDAFPGPEIGQELTLRGVRVLEYVPENALMVSSGAGADLRGIGVVWTGALAMGDKLSPLLDSVASPAYLVTFFADVDMAAARALVTRGGFAVLENPSLLARQLVIAGSAGGLEQLAAQDEVSYVQPASADLAAGKFAVACPGALSDAGPIGDYATVGSGWAKDASGGVALTYQFGALPAALEPSAVRSEIERAFREWALYANVTFSAGGIAGSARTIAVMFASGDHGDGYPFDGPGGVLAHTFYPSPPNAEPLAGDVHFDAAEGWRIGVDTDVFTVALHEAGHALGLGHSDNPASVMYPYYRFATGLTADDIAGIRALYGPSVGTTPAAPPAEPPASPAEPAVPPETPPHPADVTPPSMTLASPTFTIVSTSSASIAVSGDASDNVGVTSVKWSTSTGSAGVASGTANWSAKVPLLVGTNVITIRAYDAAGNSGWRTLTVVRR